jgi:hypothetical protein
VYGVPQGAAEEQEHGGLLDAWDTDYSSYKPGSPGGKYWFFDIARAIHPRLYKNNLTCPGSCKDLIADPTLAVAEMPLSKNPSSEQCKKVCAFIHSFAHTHQLGSAGQYCQLTVRGDCALY